MMLSQLMRVWVRVMKVGGNGEVSLVEEDGIDYAAVTVQLPGGDRVPFLFSVKELNAKGDLSNFAGDFTVPSYRGATFLAPEGRGLATGYDTTAVGLPAGGDDERLAKENIKSTSALKGSAAFSVAKYDTKTGEVDAGVFESIQRYDDIDLGAKAAEDMKFQSLIGIIIWYSTQIRTT